VRRCGEDHSSANGHAGTEHDGLVRVEHAFEVYERPIAEYDVRVAERAPGEDENLVADDDAGQPEENDPPSGW